MLYTCTKDIMIYIKQQMIAKGINNTDLATTLNKTPKAISAALRRDNVTLETLNEICQALGYDLEINLIEKDTETEQTIYNIAKAARGQQPLTMNKRQMESFAKSADKAPNNSQNRDMF